MKHIVKLVFFVSWVLSLLLTAYMFYITMESVNSSAQKWGYAVMYAITVIASSLITYNVLFPQIHDDED